MQNTKCTPDDPGGKNRVTAGFAALEFDCNTSITKVMALDCGPGTMRTLITTVGHAGVNDGYGETQRRSVVRECEDQQHALHLGATKLKGNLVSTDTYRFVETEYIVGHFDSPTEWQLLTFGRGHYGDQDTQKTRIGAGFRDQVLALSRSLSSSDHDPQPQRLELSEDLEPLAPFRGDDAATDRIISIFAPCSGAACKLLIRDWIPNRDWKMSTTRLDFDPDWLRQPAQVVASKSGKRGDLLFFSRVVSAVNGQTLDDKTFIPQTVRLEYRYLHRSEAQWLEGGAACVNVDLREQLRHMTGAPVNRYLLAPAARRCADTDAATIERAVRDAGPPPSVGSESAMGEEYQACAALLQELASRWHRSQVIPGYIVAESYARSGEQEEPSLDAAFVFNGFPSQSVRIHDGAAVSVPWAKPCS